VWRMGWSKASWAVKVAVALAPLSLIFYTIEQRSFLRGVLDRGQIFGRDFINYWTGARLLLEGKVDAAYVHADYARELLRLWGGGVGLHEFSYPPSLFPFIAWTGALDYGWAIALWSLAGAAILLAAAYPISRKPGLALLILLSPAVVVCLDVGQNGLLTAGLLLGGLRLSDRRPLLGGILLGLATFKPQLGLLIPLALIAAGRWRVIAGAAASALALAGVSVMVAGVEAWRLYFTMEAPFQRLLLEQSTGMFQTMMPSPFMAGRLIGLSLLQSYVFQGIATLACAGLVVWHFRRLRLERRAFAPLDILLLLTCGFVASPYGFNYDMAGVSVAILLADLSDRGLGELAAWRWAVVALWSAPILMVLMPAFLGASPAFRLPVGPLLVAIGLGLTLLALRQRRALGLPTAAAAEMPPPSG